VGTPARDLLDFLVKQVAMHRTGGDEGALARQRIAAEDLQPASGAILRS